MLLTSPYRAYFIFGSVNFVMSIAAFWIPETKGVSVFTLILTIGIKLGSKLTLVSFIDLFGTDG